MAGKNHRVLLAQLTDQGAHFNDLLRVQSDGRLVQNDHLRVTQHRLRKTDPLPIPFGKKLNQAVAHIRRARALHHRLNGFLPLSTRNALRFGNKAQVFLRRHIKVQRRDLRQIADAALRRDRFLKNIVPVDRDGALRCGKAAGQDVHGCGFPSAVRPEKAIDFALLHGKAQIIHREVVAVPFCQMFDFDQNPFLLQFGSLKVIVSHKCD